ncbi:MAG: AAA family ATPase [Methanoregula sp.]|nr:MAG: AAA family ATPase [Methanoregula sp.]
MLWTDTYRPRNFNEILGQEQVIVHLNSFAKTGSVPHMMLAGRHGTGKTSAVECFARALYGENWQMNTSLFQTSDLFLQGKSYLEQDERYSHLFQKQESLLTNFKYIVKSYAALRPLDADFKLMIFEDAHSLTQDAQAALRRIMERTSGTCRFLFTTTKPSAIIPAISSRCLPLFFAPIDSPTIQSHLAAIRRIESTGPRMRSCDDDCLELIVQASEGNLRRAVMLLQVAMQSGKKGSLVLMTQSETGTVTSSAITAVRRGDLRTGARELESLMIDSGLSGAEVLAEVRALIHREYNHPHMAIALADTDARLGHCNNEFVQIGSLLTDIRDVFA